jgi:hypothetical protein
MTLIIRMTIFLETKFRIYFEEREGRNGGE